MHRREFLHRTAAAGGAAGLAGCVGSSGSESAAGGAGTDADTTTDGEFQGVRSDRDEPFRTVRVGDRASVPFPDNNLPRRVRVWNAADEAREIAVQVSRRGDAVVERTVEFPADGYLRVDLNEPADYAVSVGLAGEAEAATFGVERARFDCNEATTDVGVMADGRVETFSASTGAGCPGPAVADTALTVGEATCGTSHAASVAFDGEAVAVDGRVKTSTPRSDLELATAAYDGDADALTVRVAVAGDDGGVGVQCVGETPYEATVAFEHALPATVVVVHETTDGTVEVTTADR